MVEDLLVRIGNKASKRGREDDTPKNFEIRGAKILKRKVMGLCGSNATKSLDELAAIFYNLGACDSVEDAKDMIPKLYDKNISYTSSSSHFLRLERAENSKGEEGCRLSIWGYNSD